MAASRTAHKLHTLAKLIGVLTAAGVLASAVLLPYVAGAGYATSQAANKFLDTSCDLTEPPLAQTSSVFARDNKTIIAYLFTDNRRTIPLSQVPKLVQKALIDTEDRRFYDHHGVDMRGLLRAAVNQGSGGSTQGGSTLTQQYVKQVRVYQAKTQEERDAATAQTTDRKIYEAKCALELEKKYSKPQILEKYFNIAYFGEQSYGISVAARNYFNKTPATLTVPEAAVLVGLVKDPSAYDPFKNPKAARERRDEVIDNMAKAGDITPAQATVYKNTPIKTTPIQAPLAAQGCSYSNQGAINNIGFFCDYALNWLTTTGGIPADTLASGGYRVVTSIDPALQNTAQSNLINTFPANFASTVIQPAIDPTNGEILAMATSKQYDYADAHTKDPAYTTNSLFKGAFAGSGSTYKYFALVAALTAGMKPTQNLSTAGAAPQKYYTKNCGRDNTIPSNGIANAGNYRSTLNLRDATVQSSNTFFVGLEDQVFGCDMSTIVNTAQRLGMSALNIRNSVTGVTPAQAVVRDRAYTFTLGQESTSTLELAQAYGVAANDGVLCASKPILSVTDSSGKPVAYKKPGCTQQMSPWVARTAVNIMIGDTQSGTAAREFNGGFYGGMTTEQDHLVSSKTGTNNASALNPYTGQYEDDGKNSALWFVGLTPHLVATSAIVNVDKPTSDIVLPGVADTNSATEFFGAEASKYWIGSFGARVAQSSWQWPDAASAGSPVPSVVGQSASDAANTITQAGFKPEQYPISCGGPNIPGTVNYSGPEYAQPGSIVYYCVSNGQSLTTAPQPTSTRPTGATPPATPPRRR